MQKSPLDRTLDSFVARTSKSKVAVIVPLFGYVKDAPSEQLNVDTLKLSLDRINSSVHQIYIVFVGEVKKVPEDVGNIIVGRVQAKNAVFTNVPEGSSYADYLRAGFKTVMDDLEVQFVVNINPWLIFQHNGIDIMVDRINMDDAKVISGFDLRGIIEPGEFHAYRANAPLEERDMTLDMFGFRRMMLDLFRIDDSYKTHYFMARDICQATFREGFELITTERVPIFSFKFDWKDFEPGENFEADRVYFIKKWGFDPGLKYE